MDMANPRADMKLEAVQHKIRATHKCMLTYKLMSEYELPEELVSGRR